MANYVLEIVEGPGAGRQVALDGPIEIGRDADTGLALSEDSRVSRRHVRVTPTEEGALVEDLGSANGTFVANDEVHGETPLLPGQELLVGVTVLELRTRAETTARPTAVRVLPDALADPAGRTVIGPPPGLARPESEPDYAPREALGLAASPGGDERLYPLLDVHTKGKARAAPLAIFVLVMIVVIVFLALR